MPDPFEKLSLATGMIIHENCLVMSCEGAVNSESRRHYAACVLRRSSGLSVGRPFSVGFILVAWCSHKEMASGDLDGDDVCFSFWKALIAVLKRTQALRGLVGVASHLRCLFPFFVRGECRGGARPANRAGRTGWISKAEDAVHVSGPCATRRGRVPRGLAGSPVSDRRCVLTHSTSCIACYLIAVAS
ncbi:unnamed protein product [Symbiodinium sp. CCMP2592]|nr:unnamed protein product [Symbiodinium sp. CCMP2592]